MSPLVEGSEEWNKWVGVEVVRVIKSESVLLAALRVRRVLCC